MPPLVVFCRQSKSMFADEHVAVTGSGMLTNHDAASVVEGGTVSPPTTLPPAAPTPPPPPPAPPFACVWSALPELAAAPPGAGNEEAPGAHADSAVRPHTKAALHVIDNREDKTTLHRKHNRRTAGFGNCDYARNRT